jgi:RNA polymerase sigma-70 factor (ECF subfamily)
MMSGSGPSHSEPSDGELIGRFRDGDQSAFEALVVRHQRRVYNLAYRMMGRTEEAKDATQEAFISCYRNVHRFRGEAAFSTWLYRITVNACHDLLRKRVPEPVDPLQRLEPLPAPDHAEQAAAALDVQRALLAVPPEFRAVLVMHDVQDLPYDEIARALEVPVGTVKSRLHRGRIALGRALVGEPERDPDPSNPVNHSNP